MLLLIDAKVKMSVTLLILGIWAFFIIVVLCFKNYRVLLKNGKEFLIPEWKSMYKEVEKQNGTSLACLWILFIALLLPFGYLLFFSLFPLFLLVRNRLQNAIISGQKYSRN